MRKSGTVEMSVNTGTEEPCVMLGGSDGFHVP